VPATDTQADGGDSLGAGILTVNRTIGDGCERALGTSMSRCASGATALLGPHRRACQGGDKPRLRPCLGKRTPGAAVVNGALSAPAGVHSDTLCRAERELDDPVRAEQSALPNNLAEALISFDHSSEPKGVARVVGVKLHQVPW